MIDLIIDVKSYFASIQKKRRKYINAIATAKEPGIVEPKDDKPIDPFVKIKIELRKQGISLKDAEYFISAKNIAPEEVEELSKDVEGLKVAFAEWRQENAK